MKVGPNIVSIAALIGDPARANMLTALIDGRALTASELAEASGITAQTASSHLARLLDGDLIRVEKQGRHRYFQLADSDVAHLLETLMGVAARSGRMPVRTGPKEPALRQARVCYDHLAGEFGVRMFESLVQRRLIESDDQQVALTGSGERFFDAFGIDLDAAKKRRRRLCPRLSRLECSSSSSGGFARCRDSMPGLRAQMGKSRAGHANRTVHQEGYFGLRGCLSDREHARPRALTSTQNFHPSTNIEASCLQSRLAHQSTPRHERAGWVRHMVMVA
jgi:DNA-binding transcriptional ArsR family regulator